MVVDGFVRRHRCVWEGSRTCRTNAWCDKDRSINAANLERSVQIITYQSLGIDQNSRLDVFLLKRQDGVKNPCRRTPYTVIADEGMFYASHDTSLSHRCIFQEIILDMFFDLLNIKPPDWHQAFIDGRRLTSMFVYQCTDITGSDMENKCIVKPDQYRKHRWRPQKPHLDSKTR